MSSGLCTRATCEDRHLSFLCCPSKACSWGATVVRWSSSLCSRADLLPSSLIFPGTAGRAGAELGLQSTGPRVGGHPAWKCLGAEEPTVLGEGPRAPMLLVHCPRGPKTAPGGVPPSAQSNHSTHGC